MIDTTPTAQDALIIIDVQNDFISGSLAVPGAADILPQVTLLSAQFENVVLTQDWHPIDHKSFAANHTGKAPFDMIEMPYGEQVAWPVHCVQGDSGSEFGLPASVENRAQLIVRKGFRADVDSYSAFVEQDKRTTTGLAGWLRERGITRITLCGLATDYCVFYTAMDGAAAGFDVTVDLDACRGISESGVAEVITCMRAAGIAVS